MKKLAIFAIALALLAAPLAADHDDISTAIGIVVGGGMNGGDVGLALKLAGLPIFWGIHLRFNAEGLGLGVTGDVYFIDEALVEAKKFALDWFLGVGAWFNLGFWESGNHVAVGVRVPIGLSWHVNESFELWLDLAPSLGLGIDPLNFPEWNVAAELGLRYWF